MNLQVYTLPGGIRLVHQSVTGRVAHCGVFIHAGTRDESPGEHGIAHFIEHAIFKGTTRRNVFRVLNRLENVGADLDAYTTKEETCINASFLCEHYERTLELFSDIFFHSTFPEKELEKEKQVVADEIRSYQDNPAEQIFDDFEDMVFAGHPLGRNVLGTARSLKKIGKAEILGFIQKNYRFDQVVIVSVGNIDFKRLTRLVTKYFAEQPFRSPATPRFPFAGYRPMVREVKKKTSQVHCILGTTAYPFSDDRRYPLALLNNMLGGPVMNSRLSLALRERNGLTYHNESNYTAYSDTGIQCIYFGTDPVHYDKALAIIWKELKRLREQKLTPLQLHVIKRQLAGQLAIAGESNMALMLAIGKSFLFQNRFDPMEELLSRIDEITAEQLLDISNEIFCESVLSRLTYR